MKRWIRRAAYALAGLAAFAAAGLAAGAWLGDRKLQRHVDVPVRDLAVPTDRASLDRGRYLFESRGCAECHGTDGAGRVVVDDGHGFLVKAPDITPGPGGVVSHYTTADWVRTIRHGVKPDGRPLIVMPSEDFSRFTDADVGALIAHARALPPAAGGPAVVRIPPFVRALYAAGAIRDAAEKIDHTLPPPQAAAHDGSPAHGAYVAGMCQGCHGARLSGGRIPGAPPAWPPAANLTPGAGSALAAYADERQFVAMLRSGRRPDGSAISSVMPFPSLARIDDADAAALYAYLRTLPPVAAGNR
jgi:mono/diheme cytochrome c family protein